MNAQLYLLAKYAERCNLQPQDAEYMECLIQSAVQEEKAKHPKPTFAIFRKRDGFKLPPIDDDGTGVFMAWPTREEAEKGLMHQIYKFNIDEDGDEWEVKEIT